MLVTACGVVKATALHKEPIRLRMAPSSTAHVRAYIVARDGEPSDTQPPNPDRQEELQSSPSDSHPDGRTPHQLQMDLGDAQLRKLMEDLHWEVALRELSAPTGTHHWPLGKSSGKQGPKCGWLGGHLSRGEGGNPEDNHLNPPNPIQPHECIGHLINTLGTRLWLGTPCINTFSSEAMPGKMEESFEQWYH